MKDDLNPNESRLWCRLNDEVNNIMLFMTDLHEDILIDSDVWLIDGTFKTSPRNFNQVLNIMAVNTLKKKYITVSHILLGGKKESDYTFALNTFLSQIVSSFHFLRVEVIICDFEKGLINAIQNSINNFHLNEQLNRTIRIQRCLFHYAQCLFKTFSKYYSRNNTTKQMKQILYILLYAPYLEWNLLTKWIYNLSKRKNNINQFLLYYKKIWIENKNIWHVDNHFQVSVLTNCALESYHRRLNATLRTSPSIEQFSQGLYTFDMKNLRELRVHHDQINKYQKFLLKKDMIIGMMESILENLPLLDDLAQSSSAASASLSISADAENWSLYDESHNDLITKTMFDDNLDNNFEIIDSNIDKILNQFNQQ